MDAEQQLGSFGSVAAAILADLVLSRIVEVKATLLGDPKNAEEHISRLFLQMEKVLVRGIGLVFGNSFQELAYLLAKLAGLRVARPATSTELIVAMDVL